jgi:predicted transcriptional regulator
MSLNLNTLERLEFVVKELADIKQSDAENILRELCYCGIVMQEEATELYSSRFI